MLARTAADQIAKRARPLRPRAQGRPSLLPHRESLRLARGRRGGAPDAASGRAEVPARPVRELRRVGAACEIGHVPTCWAIAHHVHQCPNLRCKRRIVFGVLPRTRVCDDTIGAHPGLLGVEAVPHRRYEEEPASGKGMGAVAGQEPRSVFPGRECARHRFLVREGMGRATR